MATKKETQADQIWNILSAIKLDLYGLSKQQLDNHVERLKVADDRVHLKIKSPAALPAMEEALNAVAEEKLGKGRRFSVEQQRNFTIVSIVDDPDNASLV